MSARDWKPHPSHRMKPWRSTVVTIIETPRFGLHCACTECGGEAAETVAGADHHPELDRVCPFNTRGAWFSFERDDGEFVYIIDHDGPRSVTNEAENVVAFLHSQYPGRRFMYRDTQGRWDELLHKAGIHTGWAPGHPPPMAELHKPTKARHHAR